MEKRFQFHLSSSVVLVALMSLCIYLNVFPGIKVSTISQIRESKEYGWPAGWRMELYEKGAGTPLCYYSIPALVFDVVFCALLVFGALYASERRFRRKTLPSSTMYSGRRLKLHGLTRVLSGIVLIGIVVVNVYPARTFSVTSAYDHRGLPWFYVENSGGKMQWHFINLSEDILVGLIVTLIFGLVVETLIRAYLNDT